MSTEFDYSEEAYDASTQKENWDPPSPNSEEDSEDELIIEPSTDTNVGPVVTNVLQEQPSSPERTRVLIKEALKVLLSIYELYGFDSTDYGLANTEEHWALLATEVGWMKFCKYKLAAFTASQLQDQELPVPPTFSKVDNPRILLGGRANKWLEYFIRSNEPLEVHSLIQTISLSKSGMPRPGEIEMKEEITSTVEILTRPKIEKEKDWIPSYEEFKKGEMIYEIKRTCRELFANTVYTDEDRKEAFVPSTSANYINSRSKAGAVGCLLNHKELLKDLRIPGGWLRGTLMRGEEEINSEDNTVEYRIDSTQLEEKFAILWDRMLKEAMIEPPDVTPVALSEALKVRIISKGPGITYTVLRSLWKKMHKTLRNHKTFKLIGEPANERTILEAMGAKIREDETFLSGDYKAATNLIESWASEVAANEISDLLRLRLEERTLFLRALTRHTIDGKAQTNGQLMGSIVSFPILCIINAAVCRHAIESSNNQPFRLLRDTPLMINGDDCLMKGKAKELQVNWKNFAEVVGLVPSIGKVFNSPHFLNINSRFFLIEKKTHEIKVGNMCGEDITRECPYRFIRHVPMGLMLGLKRSGGKQNLEDEDDPRNNIGVRGHMLKEMCPPRLWDKVLKKFLNANREMLEQTRLPWFMPQWIGGLGIPESDIHKVSESEDIDPETGDRRGIFEQEYKSSELDKRIGRAIVYNWKEKRPIPLGIANTPWFFRREAEQLLPAPYYVDQWIPDVDHYERAIGLKQIDLLFNSEIRLTDLFDKKSSSLRRVAQAIKHNAKLWNAQAYVSLPKPLTYHELRYRGAYAAMRIEFKTRYDRNPSETRRVFNRLPENWTRSKDLESKEFFQSPIASIVISGRPLTPSEMAGMPFRRIPVVQKERKTTEPATRRKGERSRYLTNEDLHLMDLIEKSGTDHTQYKL